MPHWLIKSAAQRVISWLPASHRWNAIFQEKLTKSLIMTPERLQLRIDHCRTHLDYFVESGPKWKAGYSVLEIGTGWFPVVPLGLYLCGADEVWTFDIAPLLTRQRLKQTLDAFAKLDHAGGLRRSLPHLRT